MILEKVFRCLGFLPAKRREMENKQMSKIEAIKHIIATIEKMSPEEAAELVEAVFEKRSLVILVAAESRSDFCKQHLKKSWNFILN